MRKLSPPDFGFAEALNLCIQGVGDADQVAKYQANLFPCEEIEDAYTTHAQGGDLYVLPSVPYVPGVDPVVHGALRKSELTKPYTQYLVPADKPARHLYERLKVTANGKCPLCGDIGQVRTLDHYLPKANFPVFP